jgi:hypothetical protein
MPQASSVVNDRLRFTCLDHAEASSSLQFQHRSQMLFNPG